ncbi:hypothetical protein ACQPZK_09030 [Micromonospora sp. CA-249363]|uniref:hypothetical protein n=1 Tax=Micromonospora sp. CA-249363 TaxID=3239963 RepID=UPI003D8DF71B
MRRWRWVGILALCVLLSVVVGGWQGWRSATVDPPAPPAVCPLIRSEVYDRLVPGHGTPEAAEQNESAMRSNYCRVKSMAGTKAQSAYLWVSLGRYGRYEGRGPRCLDRGGLQPAMNRRNQPFALGDGALYYLSGDRETGRRIHFSVCLGTYGVLVNYEATGIADPAVVESAATVAQEVLSWL